MVYSQFYFTRNPSKEIAGDYILVEVYSFDELLKKKLSKNVIDRLIIKNGYNMSSISIGDDEDAKFYYQCSCILKDRDIKRQLRQTSIEIVTLEKVIKWIESEIT